MPLLTTAQSRIADLQAEIEMLKQTALLDLREKRVALAQQLHEVDSELTRLTGKTLEKRTRGPGKAPVGRSIALQELKELLAAAPEKTLNLRNAGLEVRSVKVLAQANPHLLRMGGKGAWPTVMLLK